MITFRRPYPNTGGGGEGGGAGVPLTATMEKMDDIPEPYRPLFSEVGGKIKLTGIGGVKLQEDVDRVLQAKAQEVESHKTTKSELGLLKQTLGDWASLKTEDLAAIVSGYEELKIKAEAAGKNKPTDEQINQIVESRLKAVKVPLENKIKEAEGREAEYKKQIAEYQASEQKRTIHDAIRAARIEAKALDVAEEEILWAAERMFEIVDGKVVTKEGNGVTPGADPMLWFQEMQTKRPYWWPPSIGGGAPGGGKGGAPSENPWAYANWNLTKQGEFLKKYGTEKAEQMAKLAGTKVGGMKPPKP